MNSFEFCVWIISLGIFIQSGENKEDVSYEESRLINHLFKEKAYNRLIRPVKNISQNLNVYFEVSLVQIINLDVRNQIMTTNVWLRMLWSDYQLQYDPAEYGGIMNFRISPTKVWTPDLVLFNNADGNYEVSWKCNVVIYNSGTVLWIPPAIYNSSCAVDVLFFPYDEQDCEMRFGSWTYEADQVNLSWYNRPFIDLNDYFFSGSWDLVGIPGRIEINHQSRTSEIIYKITIRRKSLFYTVNLIVPCVLISMLSFCVFYLPADAGEKIALSISILLALVVFFLLISKILPPTSLSIPLISKFLLFTFILNIITLFVTVVIINWHYRTPRTHAMPQWVRSVFMRYLPKILGMKRPSHIEEEVKTDQRMQQMAKSYSAKRSPNHTDDVTDVAPYLYSSNKSNIRAKTKPRIKSSIPQSDHHPLCQYSNDVIDLLPNGMYNQNVTSRYLTRSLDDGSDDENEIHADNDNDSSFALTKRINFLINPELRATIKAINFISSHKEKKENYERILNDWKYVAAVIDRFFLLVFGSISLLGTVGVLLNTPYAFSPEIDQVALKAKHSTPSE